MLLINVFLKGCCATVGPFIFIKTFTHNHICFTFFKDNATELQLHVRHEHNQPFSLKLFNGGLYEQQLQSELFISNLSPFCIHILKYSCAWEGHEKDGNTSRCLHTWVTRPAAGTAPLLPPSLFTCIVASYLQPFFFRSLTSYEKKNTGSAVAVEAKFNLKGKTLSYVFS